MEISQDLRYQSRGLVILVGDGEFDASHRRVFTNEVDKLVQLRPQHLALAYNFANLTFINYESMSTLLDLHHELEEMLIVDYLLPQLRRYVRDFFIQNEVHEHIMISGVNKILKRLAMRELGPYALNRPKVSPFL